MEYCRRKVFSQTDETENTAGASSDGRNRIRLRDLDEVSLNKVFDMFEELSLEQGSQDELVAEATDSGLADLPQYQIDRILFEARSTYRHVLMSSRGDYPAHLPRRRLKSIPIEPTATESRRMEIARRATASDETLNLTEKRSLLQRCSLGGQSAATFVRYLAGRDDDRKIAFSPMLDFVKKEQADCRLDTLVDWLAEFWRSDPNRKAVICAGDDATVRELAEELSWRLPEVGRRRSRLPLKIVDAESSAVGGSDLRGLTGADAQRWRQSAESTVEPYSTGKSQLLIASDEYGQAINLQCSDALIFYSLPWRADMLNQWIGRVDRLGRDRVDPDQRNSPVKDVEILVLNRRGDPTEDVESVFSHHEIFQKSLQLDPALVGKISDRIDEAVDRGHASDSQSLRQADSEEKRRVNSGRWTPENAQRLFDSIAHGDPMAPVLRHCRYDAYVSSDDESAFGNWMQQLCKHEMLSKKKVAKRFRGDGKRRVYFTMTQMHCEGPKIPRLEERDQSFPAFLLSRLHALNPPRFEVVTGADQQGSMRKSRLHFLGHGGMLHQQMIETYASAGRTEAPIGFSIASLGTRFYPEGHSLEPGRYLCGVGYVDSGWVYKQVPPSRVIDVESVSKAMKRVLRLLATHREAGLRADQRFVRTLAPSRLCVRASVEKDGKYSQCSGDDLLTPYWTAKVHPHVKRVEVPENLREKLPASYRVAIASEMKDYWAERSQKIEEQINERIQCIHLETAEQLRLLNYVLADVDLQITERLEYPSDSNEQVLQLRLRPQAASLKRQIAEFTEMRDERCELLRQSLQFVQAPPPESVVLQSTAQITLRDDPEAALDLIASEADPATDFQSAATAPDPNANPRKPR
ncbi:helicase-related protein [Rhodopirellula europaea]|nr:helicase C-terminal domain-containing protein [Rhodopirellula europaea]